MHASIFLAEENQLMQTYAKSRKGRLFDQEVWNGLVFNSWFSLFVLVEQDLEQWLLITKVTQAILNSYL